MSDKVRGANPRNRAPDFENFRDSFLLVGNRGDDQVGPGGEKLLGLGGPGIGNHQAVTGADVRTDLRAIAGAGD